MRALRQGGGRQAWTVRPGPSRLWHRAFKKIDPTPEARRRRESPLLESEQPAPAAATAAVRETGQPPSPPPFQPASTSPRSRQLEPQLRVQLRLRTLELYSDAEGSCRQAANGPVGSCTEGVVRVTEVFGHNTALRILDGPVKRSRYSIRWRDQDLNA
ncbi:hypothetical protein HPB50_016830 [Hyalomma asiaticum]|uniref:Uncharacterized protein n=1 Tax=Hyalomma asiaticum TaxID=266040 RepID=A0ACB7S179_HYAAI|nr:hypothetical protein HPB50_016830 [Hyalomma asiaticum]